MRMATLCQINKNRIKNSILLLGFGISYLVIFQFSLLPQCPFKVLTGYPCPACGMTRAFQAILNGDIIGSFSYHILAFPLFVSFAVLILFLIYGMITNQDLVTKKVIPLLERYYSVIIILLLISWGINLYRGI